MTKQLTSKEINLDLEIGNKISFTNKVNYLVILTITRLEDKSIYLNGSRYSYGSIKNFMRYPDFKIIK